MGKNKKGKKTTFKKLDLSQPSSVIPPKEKNVTSEDSKSKKPRDRSEPQLPIPSTAPNITIDNDYSWDDDEKLQEIDKDFQSYANKTDPLVALDVDHTGLANVSGQGDDDCNWGGSSEPFSHRNKQQQNKGSSSWTKNEDQQSTQDATKLMHEGSFNTSNTSSRSTNRWDQPALGEVRNQFSKPSTSTREDHSSNTWGVEEKKFKNNSNQNVGFKNSQGNRASDLSPKRDREYTNSKHSSQRPSGNKTNVSNVNYSNYNTKRDEVGEEFDQFCNYANQVINYVKVVEIEGDLFAMPENFSLAHCVAEDLSMGSGIAVEFSRKFKRLDELYNQREKQGGLAILNEGKRFIYYLITKRESNGKPTMETMWRSLKKMQRHIEEHQVKELAIPRIGCGLDRLDWNKVKAMLEFLFRDIDVAITVCNFQQSLEDDTRAPVKQRKCQIINVEYTLLEIESFTMIVYFGSEDGHVTPTMSKLNNKFRFLLDYETSKIRKKGSVIRTCKQNYILYGCIVKKTFKDVIDFASLMSCAKDINKRNNADKYEYVGIEAFFDEDDSLLLFKVCNLLRSVLMRVQLYVCWPEDLRHRMPIVPKYD